MSSKTYQSASISNLTSEEKQYGIKKKINDFSLPISHSDNDILNCLKSDVCIQHKMNLVDCGVHSRDTITDKACNEEIWMLTNCINKCISRTEKKKLK
ncbi:hypothetical protein CEXT_43521 [Caerostris extrusa]|uniref:Uncharacterized protein n=1 Tax=Caerostris extrusa TaxID=172846 RepID=A0AAV4NQV9_CAEEX|nr:hypothetical protein CEXT_43521 [Caerostris extrusa]